MEKKTAFIFYANGFEEIEATATLDVLRRGGITVHTVSIYPDTLTVFGAHGLVMKTDRTISEVLEEHADALILPGGMPGSKNLSDSGDLATMLERQAQRGGVICAICAAPMVLGKQGLLRGQKATCYPSFEVHLQGAEHTPRPVVCSGPFITGQGPAFAFDFAFEILRTLQGDERVQEVREGMLFS